MSAHYEIAEVVTLDYNDLVEGKDLTQEIAKAYGFDGVGVLTVKNVPNFVEARQRLLPLSRTFALLPDEIKKKYEHLESVYSFGWSHGKESLQGKPDTSKGSYYANPQYNNPVDDEELIKKYPSFVHPNIWPREDLPELEPAFMNLGQIMVKTGELVAKVCDNYVKEKCPDFNRSLEEVIRTSKCAKGRLLHYFPQEIQETEEIKDDSFSSWCGWHNDHGSLTALTSALYLDLEGNPVINNDPDSGLFVRSRHGKLLKVNIPSDHIAYQIGETAQIHSGGFLQATPHAVRGSKLPNVSRETFAVFMEPMWDAPMDAPSSVNPTEAQSQLAAKGLPAGVPPLSKRWLWKEENGERKWPTFGEFSEETLKFYY